MPRQKLYVLDESLLEGTLAIVGDTTSSRILLRLVGSPVRFSEFDLGVSTKTLSNRLKRLERQGLITRTLHAEVPPRVEYALTEKGGELASIIEGLLKWEQSWR